MAQAEILPIDTVQELLAFREPPLFSVEPIREVKRGEPHAPRTMFCHDMMGGYLEDRFIHGCNKFNSYRFHHWQIIDSFVYYSHHLVTIPPRGWISAGHTHGVKVLGTLNAESNAGTRFFSKIRGDKLERQVATQLARIAALYRFDGWLVSVACKLDRCCMPFVKDLLRLLTEETHSAVPGSMVIWYDSLTRGGKLCKQNKLNCKNHVFFDMCDGIFLNCEWNEEMLEYSARFARDRKSDVYVGIDVFARRTNYAGGFETHQAVAQARKHGLSAGIFAAGWVYEKQDKNKFVDNQCRFWDFPDKLCNDWRVVTLPLKTSFCQGFGEKLYEAGEIVSTTPWYNLAKQQLQPRDQGTAVCFGCGSATVTTNSAYNGGGCLRLQFEPNNEDVRPYFRLFGCDVPLGALYIMYAIQPDGVDLVGCDFAIVLTVRSAEGETGEIRLGFSIAVPDEQRYCAARVDSCTSLAGDDISGSRWITRSYNVWDLSGNAKLQEIGAAFESRHASCCLLGELVVEQLDQVRDKVEEDNEEGLETTINYDNDDDDDGQPSAKIMRL
ncbi:cytosolic endo-beta-N-acetylglucosaminidase-like [Dermacentor variabilis]|uniref:cytosolic endo-beta-N-acetylglucosaminidase-like n=1 Tax=Dermacentor variabilis TaxID=34621 RepID=UPI003F5B65D3